MRSAFYFCLLAGLIALIPARDVNEKTLNLIKSFEQWKNCTYSDAVGKLTIGYGHLIKSGDNYTTSTCITMEQGVNQLKNDLTEASTCIENLVKVPLSDNEFGALVSWAFNVGYGNVQNSTLIKELNNGNRTGICDELRKWNKGRIDGGQKEVIRGLIPRREDECQLFKSTSNESQKPFELFCTIGLFGVCLKNYNEQREIYCYYKCIRSDLTGNCELNYLGYRPTFC